MRAVPVVLRSGETISQDDVLFKRWVQSTRDRSL